MSSKDLFEYLDKENEKLKESLNTPRNISIKNGVAEDFTEEEYEDYCNEVNKKNKIIEELMKK